MLQQLAPPRVYELVSAQQTTCRGGRVLDGVNGEAGLLDVELLPGHLISLPLVHLLPLERFHGSLLDVGGRRPLGFLERVAVLDQLLVQPLDLRVRKQSGPNRCRRQSSVFYPEAGLPCRDYKVTLYRTCPLLRAYVVNVQIMQDREGPVVHALYRVGACLCRCVFVSCRLLSSSGGGLQVAWLRCNWCAHLFGLMALDFDFTMFQRSIAPQKKRTDTSKERTGRDLPRSPFPAFAYAPGCGVNEL